MSAWNKQCATGPNAGKQIQAGDRIVGINDASTAAEMPKVCRERQLVNFMVVRERRRHAAPPSGKGGGAKACSIVGGPPA